MSGMQMQNPGASMVPPQQQLPFTSPNLTANVDPQRGPSPQVSYQSAPIPSQLPQLSYEQVVLKLKQIQEEIGQSEMEITAMSRSRPSGADQLPLLHNKLTKKRQQMMMMQNWKAVLERGNGQFQGQR
jgi:hypothetical protein